MAGWRYQVIVEKYWAGIARRLQIESGVMNSLIPHQGEKGIANELALARIIEDLLPPSFGVGTGVVFDHEGNTSAQTDIILFDHGQQPRLMAQTNQAMFPIETVRLVIEVKTSLRKKDIKEDFPAKRKRLHRLKPITGDVPPFGLFAYSFADSDFGRASELASLDDADAPDIACIITPGFVRTALGSGFVPLRTSENGKQWEEPPQGESSPVTIINGAEYPIFMIGKYEGQHLVGDPGRALLIFCLSMLRLLDVDRKFEWLSRYASDNLNALEPVK